MHPGPTGAGGALAAAALSALLLVACAVDVRHRRVPNALVAGVLAAGLARAAAAPGAPVGPAALAAVLGLAAWLPFYALRLLGAGDVKLFAAAAAWLGPAGVLPATAAAAAAGGVLALGAVAWRLAGAPRPVAPRGAPAARRGLPYAVAVAAGVLSVAWGLVGGAAP